MDDDRKIGWLSPTGEFFACHSYDHMVVAHRLAEPLQIPDYDYATNRRMHDDDKLLKAGWVHVGMSILGRKEWSINWDWYHDLTPEQTQFLRPYFEGLFDIPVNPVVMQRWKMEIENETGV